MTEDKEFPFGGQGSLQLNEDHGKVDDCKTENKSR